jgi:hypothetical protein
MLLLDTRSSEARHSLALYRSDCEVRRKSRIRGGPEEQDRLEGLFVISDFGQGWSEPRQAPEHSREGVAPFGRNQE